VLIFSQNCFCSPRRLMGRDSLFMLTAQGPTLPENAELLRRKSAPSRRTHTVLTSSRTIWLLSFPIYQTLSAWNRFSITWRIPCSNSRNRRGHPATNLGGRVSALDGETWIGLSEQWWLLSISQILADLLFSDSSQRMRCCTWVEHSIQENFIPCATQIIEMRHFRIEFSASEFQARHLDLRPSTNDKNIQKNQLSSPVNIYSSS
jgi:hypothetical protein